MRRLLIISAIAVTALALPASGNVEQENKRLDQLRRQIIDEVVDTAKLEQAKEAIAQARQQYDALRTAATTEVREETRYRRLLSEEQRLKEELQAIYHKYRYGIPPKDVTGPLSQEILDIRIQRTALIEAALHREAEFAAAWDDLQIAGRIYIEQVRWVPWQVRNDPRFRRALRAAGRPVR